MKKIIVAIDGFSSCGKSTMAKGLAQKTGYLYIDSGAMYRAVTLYCLQHGLIEGNTVHTNRLRSQMDNVSVSFNRDPLTGLMRTCLNNRDVEEEIRSMDVSGKVSLVSALDFVRHAMVNRQRLLGKDKGIVMDGRDIGTTVFPQAELKVFVTASARVRARRRFDELTAKGMNVSFQEILDNVILRDKMDQQRLVSPLRQAPDALLLDNTDMTPQEQLDWLVEKTNQRLAVCE